MDLGRARPCAPAVTSTLWVPAGVAPTVQVTLVLFQAVIYKQIMRVREGLG